MTRDLRACAQLFDVANSDDAVIDTVERLLTTLREARRAKTELANLPSEDLRAVLLFRANQKTSP